MNNLNNNDFKILKSLNLLISIYLYSFDNPMSEFTSEINKYLSFCFIQVFKDVAREMKFFESKQWSKISESMKKNKEQFLSYLGNVFFIMFRNQFNIRPGIVKILREVNLNLSKIIAKQEQKNMKINLKTNTIVEQPKGIMVGSGVFNKTPSFYDALQITQIMNYLNQKRQSGDDWDVKEFLIKFKGYLTYTLGELMAFNFDILNNIFNLSKATNIIKSYKQFYSPTFIRYVEKFRNIIPENILKKILNLLNNPTADAAAAADKIHSKIFPWLLIIRLFFNMIECYDDFTKIEKNRLKEKCKCIMELVLNIGEFFIPILRIRSFDILGISDRMFSIICNLMEKIMTKIQTDNSNKPQNNKSKKIITNKSKKIITNKSNKIITNKSNEIITNKSNKPVSKKKKKRRRWYT